MGYQKTPFTIQETNHRIHGAGIFCYIYHKESTMVYFFGKEFNHYGEFDSLHRFFPTFTIKKSTAYKSIGKYHPFFPMDPSWEMTPAIPLQLRGAAAVFPQRGEGFVSSHRCAMGQRLAFRVAPWFCRAWRPFL